MKRCIALLLALICLMSASPRPARADTEENMQIVYTYLTGTLGLNRAAACGIMSNIQSESNFRPGAIGDGGNAYGICQWNSRRQSLINYCERNGFESWQDIYGQLGYLGYELENNKKKVGVYLRGVPDSAQGAYDAGWYFCVYFEIPANRYEKGVKRGTTAVKKYYPMYGGTYDSYTIRFDANQGSAAPAAQTKYEGIPLTLSSGEPIRPEYRFAGWADEPTAFEAQYPAGGSYILNQNAVLFAVWTSLELEGLRFEESEEGLSVVAYSGEAPVLTLPQTAWERSLTRIARGAFAGSAQITVYVPSGVSCIEEGAFAPDAKVAAYPGSYAHLRALELGLGYVPVYEGGVLRLPDGLTALDAEAFSGTSFTSADLYHTQLDRIESGTFSACAELKIVSLPPSISYIAQDALPRGVTVLSDPDSAAKRLAEELGLGFLPIR